MTVTISTASTTKSVAAVAPLALAQAIEKPRESFTISCDDCVLRRTSACDDCIVTFICGREFDDAVVVDVAEIRAWRMLSDEGLVPELRHRRLVRSSGAVSTPDGSVGAVDAGRYESTPRVVSR